MSIWQQCLYISEGSYFHSVYYNLFANNEMLQGFRIYHFFSVIVGNVTFGFGNLTGIAIEKLLNGHNYSFTIISFYSLCKYIV